MPMFPNFWRAGATTFMAVWFICIPGRADTRPHEYGAGNELFCDPASKNVHDCAQACEPPQCRPEGSNNSYPHIVQTPKLPRPSARPDQSRPAYSRKSNRTQRA
jgi:hypothetical protein